MYARTPTYQPVHIGRRRRLISIMHKFLKKKIVYVSVHTAYD